MDKNQVGGRKRASQTRKKKKGKNGKVNSRTGWDAQKSRRRDGSKVLHETGGGRVQREGNKKVTPSDSSDTQDVVRGKPVKSVRATREKENLG